MKKNVLSSLFWYKYLWKIFKLDINLWDYKNISLVPETLNISYFNSYYYNFRD